MSANTDVRAFPVVLPENGIAFEDGMTLRDWFAGQALVGMLADHTCDAEAPILADIAYKLAEAMLAHRVKYE